MSAKPSKCIAIGFILFDKHSKQKNISCLLRNLSSFWTLPNHWCQPIYYIVNPQEKDPLKAEHFNFLGGWTHPLLKEKDFQLKLQLCLNEDLQLIEDSKVNGLMKLWLFQFYALQHLSWPFIINDLNIFFLLSFKEILTNNWRNAPISVVQLTMDYFSVKNRTLVWVLLQFQITMNLCRWLDVNC